MSSSPAMFQSWSPAARFVVFLLSATSIWCLLAEFYGLCSMRVFTFAILIPATAALVALALVNRNLGDGTLYRSVVVGALAGLLAAVAYDLFRVPFVVAAADSIGPAWLRMPLFKVFPRFGALILNEPFDTDTPDSRFSLAAHLVGWTYHFSNGITFGVMYMTLVGRPGRHSWLSGLLMATGLELAMLLTPYTGFFGIAMTARFVIVTFAAHAIFGVVLGVGARWLAEIAAARRVASAC